MPFLVEAVANHILGLARNEGIPITAMKLQKLVYFAHGWHLAVYDKPLVDCEIEAWKFGPVIPQLYKAVRNQLDNAWQPISKEISCYPDENGRLINDVPRLSGDGPDVARARNLISAVWDTYKEFSAEFLSEMTHAPDTPWYKIWNAPGAERLRGQGIPNELIKSYFEQKRKTRTPAATA